MVIPVPIVRGGCGSHGWRAHLDQEEGERDHQQRHRQDEQRRDDPPETDPEQPGDEQATHHQAHCDRARRAEADRGVDDLHAPIEQPQLGDGHAARERL
jgi:hypothetical protein